MSTDGKIILGITLFSVVLLTALVMLGAKKSKAPDLPSNLQDDFADQGEEAFPVGDLVNDTDYQSGNPDAAVTLVEFSDFECPYCQQVHPEIMKLRERYTDEQLRIVFRHLPLTEIHDQAYPAAIAAQAAHRQGKFAEYASKMFELAAGNALNDQAYEQTAQELSLNLEQFKTDLEDSQVGWAAFRGRRYIKEVAGLELSTPMIFLNGEQYGGDQTAAALSTQIDLLLGIGQI